MDMLNFDDCSTSLPPIRSRPAPGRPTFGRGMRSPAGAARCPPSPLRDRPCNVGAGHEKGRVEAGVAYVKKNLLAGLDITDFRALNPAARRWLAWTYPSKKSLESLKRKVRSWTTRSTTYLTLEQLLHHLNPMVRGWTTYFRYDAAKRTFACVDHFVWWRVMRWLRKKHPKRGWR